MWQGEVPSRLVVGMVKSQAYNGDYNLNPYHFEHFDVSNIGFFVNGESTPRPSFILDVGNGIYLQGLNSLYKITGKTMENSDIGISRETYRETFLRSGRPLFWARLTASSVFLSSNFFFVLNLCWSRSPKDL